MNRKIKRILAMLLVTVTCFSTAQIMSINAFAVEAIHGDVNQDGVLDDMDAHYILRYVAKLEPLNETQLSLADYDKNGVVDMADVKAILKLVSTGGNFEEELHRVGFPESNAFRAT